MIKKIKIEEVHRFQRIAGLLKEEDLDLSNTPEFNKMPNLWDEAFRDFVWDYIGDYHEHKFGATDPEDISDVVGQYLQNLPYNEVETLWSDYIEDKRASLRENDIDLSDIPKFNEGNFKTIFTPLLRKEGVQDDRYYNLFLHGYMENEFQKRVKGKDIPEVYESIVTDYDWAGRGNVQHLEDAIENLGTEEGFPEGCLEPSPSGGIVSLLVSDDTVLDIVEAPVKENDIDLSDTPQFTDLNKSKIQREFKKAGVDFKRPIFVYSIDYGMAKRSVKEYIDELVDTIYDLESDPEYGNLHGNVELEIVSNPDDVDPFEYFVEYDPKDIKLVVSIPEAIHDFIFQK